MQFFYDVSELAQHDHQTGIQRVVRSVLAQLLADPPAGFKVEPVLAHRNLEGYHYARRFTQAFLGLAPEPANGVVDSPVKPQAGDIFLRLELQPEVVLMQARLLRRFAEPGRQDVFWRARFAANLEAAVFS